MNFSMANYLCYGYQQSWGPSCNKEIILNIKTKQRGLLIFYYFNHKKSVVKLKSSILTKVTFYARHLAIHMNHIYLKQSTTY